MRQFYFLVVFLVCSVAVSAQKNGSVKGIAYDTLSRKTVADATITVLVKKDSSLFTFGMTDNAGRFNTKYFSQLYEAEFNWQLPKGFYFSTDFGYTINNQRAAGFNTQVPLWNASISKHFLRFNRGELKLRVNDILNRNIGISRSSNQNYIEDSRVNTLRRFALLTFTYSLSKTGLSTGRIGDIKMIRR